MMISVELAGKVLKVCHSDKVFNLTDENGQILIDNLISLDKETTFELLNSEANFILTDNDEVDNGLKLFVTAILGKLKEEKSSQ